MGGGADRGVGVGVEARGGAGAGAGAGEGEWEGEWCVGASVGKVDWGAGGKVDRGSDAGIVAG